MGESENGASKRRATDPATRTELLRQFHESGQTRKAFSASRGIRLSTLNYWLTCEKRRAMVAPPVVFNEFKVSGQAEDKNAWAMEVISPEGLTVRSREALPSNLLFRLLALRRC